MAYEPTAKVKAVIDAMRAAPDRTWTSEDVAPILGVPRGQVPSYLETAVRNGKVFRRVNGSGRLEFSAQPFPVGAPASAPAELNIPRFTPPRMEAPRAGSDVRQPSRAPGPPPAPSPQAAPAPAPAATPAPTPAPSPAPAPLDHAPLASVTSAWPQPVGAGAEESTTEGSTGEVNEVDEPEEAVEPNAFVDVSTGEIQLVGCVIDPDGRVYVPAELVRRIVGRMAWSPLR